MSYYTFNAISIIVSLVVFLGYNFYAYANSFSFDFLSCSSQTFETNKKKLRTSGLWIDRQVERNDPKNVELAIHTFRNTIIVASLLGLANLYFFINVLNSYPEQNNCIDQARVIILSMMLLLSLLCWLCYARCVSIIGYQSGLVTELFEKVNSETKTNENKTNNIKTQDILVIDDDDIENDPTKLHAIYENVSQLLIVMTLSFSLGFRFLFMSIPFALYIAGPIALVISTFVILIFLWFWDNFIHKKKFG